MIAVARADLRRMLARRGLILASVLVPVAIVLVLAAVLMFLHVRNAADHPSVGGSSFFSVGSAFDRYSLLKPTLSTPQGLKDAHTFTPSDLRRRRSARSDPTTSGDLLEWRVD